MSRTHKPVSPDQVHGRTIARVYDADHLYKAYRTKAKVPGSKYLLNFELKFGGRHLLVLDNYGAHDGGLPVEVGNCLGLAFANKGASSTLAIDKSTGEVYSIGFGIEQRQVIAIVWAFAPDGETPFKLPRVAVQELDQLKSCKRPFRLALDMAALCSFITQETGYQELRKAVTLVFDFKPKNLELQANMYRHVTEWK